MGPHDRGVVADSREPGDLAIPAGRVGVVAGPRAVQEPPHDREHDHEHDHRGRDRTPALVAETTEGGRHVAGRSRVVLLQVAADDQRDAEGGDERVHPERGDDQPVDQADDGSDEECREHAPDDLARIAVHGLGGDQRAQADQVGHREVERPGEDDDGLADRDQAEGHAAARDVEDAALVEQHAALHAHQHRAGEEQQHQGGVHRLGGGQHPEPSRCGTRRRPSSYSCCGLSVAAGGQRHHFFLGRTRGQLAGDRARRA